MKRFSLALLAYLFFQLSSHAFYNASSGRWLSRDPAEEGLGGINLFTFVLNDPATSFDAKGLWHKKAHEAIIDDWIKPGAVKWNCCNIDVRGILKSGSAYVDGTPYDSDLHNALPGHGFYSALRIQNSYKHAMRAGNRESASEAETKYYQFVLQNVSDALNFADRAKSSTSWQLRCANMRFAIFSLGKAYHSISDNLSPAHQGFQSWWGPFDDDFPYLQEGGWVFWALSHAKKETEEAYRTSPNRIEIKNEIDYQLGTVLHYILEDE